MNTDFGESTNDLLRLLAAPADQARQAASLRGFTEGRWNALLQQAEQHAVTLLLYDRLAAAECDAPPWLMERLRQDHLGAAVKNTLMLHHAAQILTALNAQGIEVIALKGLYLVENVYANISLRTFGDLDLLVRRARLADSLALMQRLGYALSSWYDPGAQNTDLKHLPPLEKAGAPTVELHWTTIEEDEPFSVDAEGLWQRAVPALVAGVPARALVPDDLLLHLALHFTYQHRLRAGLRNLYDIAAVLQQHPQAIDWQRLERTAREWGAERVTWLTFSLLARLTGAEVPAAVMTALQPAGDNEGIVQAALAQVLESPWQEEPLTPDLADLPAADGPGGKAALVWRRVFIPRRLLAREYNLDPRSAKLYGYYLVRLRDLWRRYARTGWRLVSGAGGALTGVDAQRANQRLREWLTGGGANR